MFKLLTIIIILFHLPSSSEEFKLICTETDSLTKSDLNSNFSKIINLQEQTLINFSGGYFDNVVLFGRNEIIINNKVFNTRSTYNIITSKWITYKGQFIKIYNCTKEKRRF